MPVRKSSKAVPKRKSGKKGEICFPVASSVSPKRIKVFNLKKGRSDLTVDELSDILKKASRAKVGFVVLNAPFKLREPAKPLVQS